MCLYLSLGPLPADAAGQLHVLDLDGLALGVDGNEVDILKETNEINLTGLLKGQDGRGLEAQVRLHGLGDLANQALERSPVYYRIE